MQDSSIENELQPGILKLDEERLKVIGESEVLLSTSRQVRQAWRDRLKVSQEESTLGNMITDAMVWGYRDKRDDQQGQFLLALHHSGGIRSQREKVVSF